MRIAATHLRNVTAILPSPSSSPSARCNRSRPRIEQIVVVAAVVDYATSVGNEEDIDAFLSSFEDTGSRKKKKKGEGKEKGKKEERRRKFLPRVKLWNQRDYNNKTRERFFRIFASDVIEILLLN